MSVLEASAAGIAWMVIAMLACYAANYSVINMINRQWGQGFAWCAVCAVLFIAMFGSIPLVWAATC